MGGIPLQPGSVNVREAHLRNRRNTSNCRSSSASVSAAGALAPGLTACAVLEILAPIQMLDVTFPTKDGRRLVMPRCAQPTLEHKLLPHQPQLTLRNQPPHKIQLRPDTFLAGMLRLQARSFPTPH